MQVLKVKDLKPDDIFETLWRSDYEEPHVASGNIYRVATIQEHQSTNGVTVWKRFRQGKTFVHGDNLCRVIYPQTDIELEF